MKEKETKIRPMKGLRYGKFLAKEYIKFTLCSDEEAGKVLKDLIMSIIMDKPAIYPENQATIDEAWEYWENRQEKIAEWRKKKDKKENKPEGPNLFKQPNLPPLETTPAHELEKFARENGIAPNDFHRWYEDTKENNWQANGRPIDNWLACCRSYIKFNPKKGDNP
ncbi:MAG: hypothetical protein LBU89_00760 [Fibromonadaceae bacterium]|jgi:hypothetical protein|nr:hypothetical protein [Fibromonadaceae bacterium]